MYSMMNKKRKTFNTFSLIFQHLILKQKIEKLHNNASCYFFLLVIILSIEGESNNPYSYSVSKPNYL
jgi:hypothetical protein